MCRLLLDHGASADEADEEGDTPLHAAAYHGRLGPARVLLEHPAADGADLAARLCCARNNFGRTALHEAAESRRLDICRILLQRGALVDEIDDDGDTPIYLAIWRFNLDIARLLLEHRAKGAPPVRPLDQVTKVLVRRRAKRDDANGRKWQAILKEFEPQFEDAQDEPKMEQPVLEEGA